MVALDHVYVCATLGAPGTDLLVDFGLAEAVPDTHPGQGTFKQETAGHQEAL